VAGHLADGFGADGMWWEGENYHLFALRGLMTGIRWARLMDFDLLQDEEVRAHFRTALLAPAMSALPDGTYPARHDSRFGVSLAHPASLELWEMGRHWLGPDDALEGWLTALYRLPAPAIGEGYDAWLHDAGQPAPESHQRTDLSWWAAPAIPLGPPRELGWEPGSVLLPQQGLAILRKEDSYASLECGGAVPGHGHPSRLHLTVHAGGMHWLPDPGTGSYVQETLFWYRSALAHNAPLLDGEDAGGVDAWCAGFEAGGDYAWCRGRAGGLTRTLILSRDRLVDLLAFEGDAERQLILPWHFRGEFRIESPGSWEPAQLEHPFVTAVEQDTGDSNRVRETQVTSKGTALQAFLHAPGAELLRARAPGLPGETEERPFLLLRDRTRAARWITVLDFAPSDSPASVTGIAADGESVEVRTRGGTIRYREHTEGLLIEFPGGSTELGNLRPAPRPHRPMFAPRGEPDTRGFAPRIEEAPALDGSLTGFDDSAPLTLDNDHQYRRSEEPYDPEVFSAEAVVNWDGKALFLAVSVRKPERVFRAADAPPLDLDNEPEDVHSDGIQVYLGEPDLVAGILIVPQEGGTLLARPITDGESMRTEGSWSPTAHGYLITLRLDHSLIERSPIGAQIGFDLLINEMRPERVRRAGQLVWSGGNGWIYLRGDRQNPGSFGLLELG
jgi:hypothetical protein